jgi:hypothetical protein
VNATQSDIEALAKQIRYDASVLQTRLNELMRMVASLPIPEDRNALVCPYCGGLSILRNEKMLREHLENVHGELAERSAA